MAHAKGQSFFAGQRRSLLAAYGMAVPGQQLCSGDGAKCRQLHGAWWRFGKFTCFMNATAMHAFFALPLRGSQLGHHLDFLSLVRCMNLRLPGQVLLFSGGPPVAACPCGWGVRSAALSCGFPGSLQCLGLKDALP